MISGTFIDRPRLAIVIAVLITIAGLLAMRVIPVSQFPDIVPPQVQVTTRYPGASAAVVEQTVAQPLEAQVNGADQMIYMKSNSGNDGSYGLTVSFALGTNPDINTVNVNNRVQAALSRLPQEVQRQGVTVQKRSSAILEFLAFSSEGAKQVAAVHLQLRHDQRAGPAEPGVRRGIGFVVRGARLLHADLVRHQPADRAGAGAKRHHPPPSSSRTCRRRWAGWARGRPATTLSSRSTCRPRGA